MGVSQLLGARARAAPQVYAYDRLHSWNHVRNFPVKPMHWFYNANCAMVQNTRILLLSCLRFIFPHCRSTFRCDLACIRNLIINNNKNNDFICNPGTTSLRSVWWKQMWSCCNFFMALINLRDLRLKCQNTTRSVSGRFQKEDLYSHPGVEFWTYGHCWRLLYRHSWTVWTYFSDVKTPVWALRKPWPQGCLLWL